MAPTCLMRKCCCCIKLVGGSWIVGLMALLVYLICAVVLVIKAIDDADRRVLFASLAGLATLMAISACYLIHGLRKKIPAHLTCWVWTNMGILILIMAVSVALAFYFYLVHHNKESGIYCVITCVVALCCTYFIVVVYSCEIEMRKKLVADPAYWDKEHLREDPF